MLSSIQLVLSSSTSRLTSRSRGSKELQARGVGPACEKENGTPSPLFNGIFYHFIFCDFTIRRGVKNRNAHNLLATVELLPATRNAILPIRRSELLKDGRGRDAAVPPPHRVSDASHIQMAWKRRLGGDLDLCLDTAVSDFCSISLRWKNNRSVFRMSMLCIHSRSRHFTHPAASGLQGLLRVPGTRQNR